MAKPSLSIIEMISISYEWGGIEQHVKDLSEGLRERGHNVMVVCRDFKMHVDAYSEKCPVHTLPIRNAVDLETIWGLAKLIKQQRVDIIHTHTSRDSWLALFASWLAGRGKVVTTRHVPFLAKQDAFHTWYYNQLSGIICVSEFVKGKFLGAAPKLSLDKIEVIHPGIKVDKNRKIVNRIIREQLGIDQDTYLIGFVGRITAEKGLDDLLEAVAILKNKHEKKFKVVLVGGVNPMTPEYLDHLKSKVQELGIGDYIHFYGFSHDIPSVMADLDVLVLPSTAQETFGLVLCEAMLAGTPVVSTNAGAQAEIVIEGVNGFLIDVASPISLAENLNKVRELNWNKSAIRESVIQRYSKERMIVLIEDFLWSGT